MLEVAGLASRYGRIALAGTGAELLGNPRVQQSHLGR